MKVSLFGKPFFTTKIAFHLKNYKDYFKFTYEG